MPIPANIEAVSTKPGGVTLFTHDPDGQFYTASLDPEYPGSGEHGWGDWVPLGPMRFPERTPVTAVSTKRGGVNVFAVGPDQRVWSTFYDPTNLGPNNGWHPWFALGMQLFPILSRVCAVSPRPGALVIFAVSEWDAAIAEIYAGSEVRGPTGFGHIWTAEFDPRNLGPLGGYHDWILLGPNTFPFPSRLTAVSPRTSLPGRPITTLRPFGGVVLFVGGQDGQVWYIERNPLKGGPSNRRGFQFWKNLSPNEFPSPTTVAGTSSRPDEVSIYTLGFDEWVWGKSYLTRPPIPGQLPPWTPWVPFGPNRFPRPSSVSAISTKPFGTSLFITGFDGRVWGKGFDPDKLDPDHQPQLGGWSKWFAIGSSDKRFPTPGDVTAVSSKRLATELFIMDEAGRVCCAFFDPTDPGDPQLGNWHDWFQIGTRAFRPVEEVRCVRLHIKVLVTPTVAIATMINSMDQVYQEAGIRVAHITNEFLNLPLLTVLGVGQCKRGQTTAQQNLLFSNANFLGQHDVVAYFVNTITLTAGGTLAGCAVAPVNRFGITVASNGSRWTLGHELGHLFGLIHPDDPPKPPELDRLMTGQGTFQISNPPADLVAAEIATLRANPFLVPGWTV